MKESGNLPWADTRKLPKILASHMWGLAVGFEPSRLNVVFWIKGSIQNVCEDDGCRADVAERETLRSVAPERALTVS